MERLARLMTSQGHQYCQKGSHFHFTPESHSLHNGAASLMKCTRLPAKQQGLHQGDHSQLQGTQAPHCNVKQWGNQLWCEGVPACRPLRETPEALPPVPHAQLPHSLPQSTLMLAPGALHKRWGNITTQCQRGWRNFPRLQGQTVISRVSRTHRMALFHWSLLGSAGFPFQG